MKIILKNGTAAKVVGSDPIIPPARRRTHYLAQLSVLRSNIMLVASNGDDQGEIELNGVAISDRLAAMADELSDMAAAVKRGLDHGK